MYLCKVAGRANGEVTVVKICIINWPTLAMGLWWQGGLAGRQGFNKSAFTPQWGPLRPSTFPRHDAHDAAVHGKEETCKGLKTP